MSDDPNDFTARIILKSLNNRAEALLKAGDRAGALEVYQSEHEESARLLGPDDPETLARVHDMAVVMHLDGDPRGADEILAPAIERLAASLGDGHEDHLDYLQLRGCHGRVLSELGEHGRATDILRDVVDRRARFPGEGDWMTVAGLLDLAAAQRAAGDHAGAGKTYVRTRKASCLELGEQHEFSLQALTGEAGCFLGLGDLAMAGNRLRRVYEAKLALFGEGTVETALSKMNLAGLLTKDDQNEEAAVLLEDALAILETGLGPGAGETSMTLTGLGAAISALGRHWEAVQLMREKLADREEKLGEDHEATLAAEHDLGLALDAAGESEQARWLFERTQEKCMAILGPNHVLSLVSSINVGKALAKAGELDRAEELFRGCLEGLKAFFGPAHHNVRLVEANLSQVQNRRLPPGLLDFARNAWRGRMNMGMGMMPQGFPPLTGARETEERRAKLEKARARAASAVDARKAILGEDDPATVEAAHDLACVFLELGIPMGACAVCLWAVPASERAHGKNGEMTIRFLMAQGTAHLSTGAPDKAGRAFGKALAGAERLFGPGSEQSLDAAGCLASVHIGSGEFQAAADLLSKAAAAGEAVCGPVHPLVVNLSASHGEALLRLGRFGEAEARLRRALELMERDPGPGGQRRGMVAELLREARAGRPKLKLTSGDGGNGGVSGDGGNGGVSGDVEL
ncbi:MAG: tetratricopeptide repeat protein [Deltaproteobacteria bacterium]|jgi:tetratricopeptide (TPR) repeat protein|nr:tetratricopeptide repeat protein [Deltaproteobacteria bacterium]